MSLNKRKLSRQELADNFSDADGLIDYEQWEERVFLAAVKYSTNVPLGKGRVRTKWYATYPEAMLLAMHTPRAMLYCTTQSGRSVIIRRKDYEHYLKVYNKATGQFLRMPEQPVFEQRAKRKKVRVLSK